MSSVLTELPTIEALQQRLGDVPRERILDFPTPGTATEADLENQATLGGFSCELVDGVLVEKAVGFSESWLALLLVRALMEYLKASPLGILGGEQGFLRLAPGLVRGPDVSFISWKRLPGGRVPTAPVPDLAPDLAVEILSPGNTRAEMDRKLRDYFGAGTRLVWIIDPPARTARVYTAPDQFVVVDDQGTLEGGEVLPGFRLPLGPWLNEATAGAPE